MRILITGGAGFIGSHLVLRWVEKRPEDVVCNLDKLSYASDPSLLEPVARNPRYRFEKVDLCERAAVRRVLRDFKPDGILHLAAESHVDNSIAGPEPFVMSNVVGTFNLLEEARQLWTETGYLRDRRFLQVSTDEVFGQLGPTGAFEETTPFRPNSPYSASKAGADHLVRSYRHTYGMNTVTTHCSNNYGPHQHAEKLIPTVIRTALAHQPIPVYGQGANVRDWLYVTDHCAALEMAFDRGTPGAEFCIGGRKELRNIDLVRRLCELLDQVAGGAPEGGYASLISFVKDRAGHDFRYAIDPSWIEKELGWRPSTDFDGRLRETVEWFVAKFRKQSEAR